LKHSLSSAGFTGCETFMTYPNHAAASSSCSLDTPG
jgi:hypothetical protein